MKHFLIRLIRLYQRQISAGRPPRCRYIPSCSAYALEAIERYGAFRGGGKALWRILRCNPFSKGGYDPVDPADKARYAAYLRTGEILPEPLRGPQRDESKD